MARGSDQCVWSVCVVSKCGCWVWSLGGALGDVISGQCVFKLSNMHPYLVFIPFFRYITFYHHPYIA